jgi:MYXO-CTERM domain-containing protein
MRTHVCVAFLLVSLVWAASAQAHIQLNSPTARYVQDNGNGLKTAPCGAGTATGAVTKLVPGQSLTVTWKESISHAGHFRIALSDKESDFVEPTSLDIPSTLPAWDLVDGIQDKTGTQTYTQTVQIPNTECPACVLQLLQIMSTGTDGTNTGPFSGVYHACADLNISASNGGDAGAGGGADALTGGDARADLVARDLGGTGGSSRDGAAASGGTSGAGGASGSGGATSAGDGGSPGSGGEAAATGGMSGSGGQANGSGGGAGGASSRPGSGGSGQGGTSATGGSPGTGGLGSGGSGSGGTSGGSGGAASSGGATSTISSNGAGGSGGPVTTNTANGCACQVGAPVRGAHLWLGFALLGLALGWRRRSSRRQAPPARPPARVE